MRYPAFCICENKDADQLRGNREADQRLCFRYTDSTIPLLPKSEISSLLPSSVTVQPGLCQTWSETPKTDFLTTRPKSEISSLFPSSVTVQPGLCLTSTEILKTGFLVFRSYHGFGNKCTLLPYCSIAHVIVIKCTQSIDVKYNFFHLILSIRNR